MEDHDRVRKKRRSVKVNRIQHGSNILILSDCKGERKANATLHDDKIR